MLLPPGPSTRERHNPGSHPGGGCVPSSAAQALAGSLSRGFGSGHDPITHLLAWWQGGLIMLAWGLIPLWFGYFTTVRRDVT